MEPPLPGDTDPATLKVWLEIQRRMTPAEKLHLVLESSVLLLQMYEAGVRLHYPHAADREVFLRVAARHLDRETMIRAYGWDPEGADLVDGSATELPAGAAPGPVAGTGPRGQ